MKNIKKTIAFVLMICFGASIFTAIFDGKFSTAAFAAILTALSFLFWRKQPNMVDSPKQNKKQSVKVRMDELHFNILSHNHQEEIESLTTRNNIYFGYSRKEFMESVREGEMEYEYEFEESSPRLEYVDSSKSESGKDEIYVYVSDIIVGYVKWGAVPRLRNLMEQGKVDHIYVNLTGGRWKMYEMDEDEKPVWDSGEDDYGADLYVYVRASA